MVTINWRNAAHRPTRCPVCDNDGSRQRLLEITVTQHPQNALATDFLAFLRCPSCDARYCDPLRAANYEAADAHGRALATPWNLRYAACCEWVPPF